jgi:hypothetical protein
VTGAAGAAAGPVDVTDRTVGPVLAAPRAALILTRAGCGPCAVYRAEVAALLAQGKLDGIAVGTLALDRPGASRFKRANPWLAGLRYLPHTVLYRRGQRVDSFAASKGAYLLERTAAAFGPSPVGPA